jgi:hypothetical protein
VLNMPPPIGHDCPATFAQSQPFVECFVSPPEWKQQRRAARAPSRAALLLGILPRCSLRSETPHAATRFAHMDDDEAGTVAQRLANLEAKANTIRGLLKKARLDVLAKPNVDNAMRVVGLEDLLKSTVARAEWLRTQGRSDH